MKPAEPSTLSETDQQLQSQPGWRALGQCVQALVVGQVLFFAFWVLFSVQAGARVFRYAGF